MKTTIVNIISHLQLYFAELPGYYIRVEIDSKLTGRFTGFMIILLIFFLVKHNILSIAYLI